MTPNQPKELPKVRQGTAELITEKRFCFSLSPAWRNRDHPPGGTTQDKDSDEAKKQKMLPRLQWACVIRGLEGRGKRPESQDEQRPAPAPRPPAHHPAQAAGSCLPGPTSTAPSGEELHWEPKRINGHHRAPCAAWERTRSKPPKSSVRVWRNLAHRDQQGGRWRALVLPSGKPLPSEHLYSVTGGASRRLPGAGDKGRLLDARREGACPGGEPGCRLDPDPTHVSLRPGGETEAGPQVRAI